MLISKFDLYKSEWLELVFDHRNKAYGAYNLRQHYAKNMVMAMSATFLGIGLLFGAGFIFRSNPVLTKITPVDMTPKIIAVPSPAKPVKKIEPPATVKAQPAKPVATQRVLPPVVVPDPQAQTSIKNADIVAAVGQVTTKGPATSINVPVEINTGPGTATKTDNTVHQPFGLDVMPAPVGGDKAWAKFLNKNLRFPDEAQQDGVSGRVILSFIVEKDGTLSNITVDRPAGHGFDEEALRVLKLAKAWKPGIQNGQPVRVKFEIPINFQLSSD